MYSRHHRLGSSHAREEDIMPAIPSPGDTTCQAALERLDAALDPGEFATTLTARPGVRPRLTVTNRHAAIGDDIWADNRAYYYSWGEWIAPISDPATVARMISTVLRAVPQPAP
jgi:hypothetical protein